MRIGLLDADSHNFPNLCLMKLSGWHKAQGDEVERWMPDNHYDCVYVSKVFSESVVPEVHNSHEVLYGGSGFDLENKLPYEIEHQTPDYALYPQFDFAVGWLTRGCPRCNHTFCITPKKDGKVSVKTADLTEFWTGQSKIVLLDQNLLACRERLDLIGQLDESGATCAFNGGLDARFMDDEVIEAMRGVKVNHLHFAWDDPKEDLAPAFKRIAASGLQKPNNITVYVLVNFWSTHEEDLHRIYTLRSLGLMPYVMIYDKQKYVNDRGRWLPGVEQKFTEEQRRHFKICQHMQRWCNSRSIIKICPKFEDYEPYRKIV